MIQQHIDGIKVARGNDLIFPGGNERGEYSEPLWIAAHDSITLFGAVRGFHGSTPQEARERCIAAMVPPSTTGGTQ